MAARPPRRMAPEDRPSPAPRPRRGARPRRAPREGRLPARAGPQPVLPRPRLAAPVHEGVRPGASSARCSPRSPRPATGRRRISRGRSCRRSSEGRGAQDCARVLAIGGSHRRGARALRRARIRRRGGPRGRMEAIPIPRGRSRISRPPPTSWRPGAMPLDPSRYFPVMCLTQDGLGMSHAAQAARLCSAGALWIQLRMKGAARGRLGRRGDRDRRGLPRLRRGPHRQRQRRGRAGIRRRRGPPREPRRRMAQGAGRGSASQAILGGTVNHVATTRGAPSPPAASTTPAWDPFASPRRSRTSPPSLVSPAWAPSSPSSAASPLG